MKANKSSLLLLSSNSSSSLPRYFRTSTAHG
jgi:hypothetical protein